MIEAGASAHLTPTISAGCKAAVSLPAQADGVGVGRRDGKSTKIVLAALAVVALAGGFVLVSHGHAGSNDFILKASDVAGPWPLTVSQIKVECADDLAIYAKVRDKTYPLNGQAQRQSIFYKEGPVTRLEDIQKNDPWSTQFIPDAKMSMDPVSQEAIKRCELAGRWLKT